MAERVSDFEEKFLYTKTNPENIIEGKQGSWFFRYNHDFYVNRNDSWEKLPYRTVILPFPDEDRVLKYEHPYELWFKSIDGFFDDERKLLPKTGWKFFGYKNVFTDEIRPVEFIWEQVPTSSYDPKGTEKSKSYDENFFYFKTGSIWYRSPITIFDFPDGNMGEHQQWYTSLPFVRSPRYLPIPTNTFDQLSVQNGEETYDDSFYYIKPSRWKRSVLATYDPFKMAIF